MLNSSATRYRNTVPFAAPSILHIGGLFDGIAIEALERVKHRGLGYPEEVAGLARAYRANVEPSFDPVRTMSEKVCVVANPDLSSVSIIDRRIVSIYGS